MDTAKGPRSIGIIMDGNRRFAKEKGLPSLEGHRLGYETLKNVCRWAKESGVKYLTIFAFSTENWNRDKVEVEYLLTLFRDMLSLEKDSLRKEGIKLQFAGDISRFPNDLQTLIAESTRDTEKYDGLVLSVCMSYGGRDEILRAMKKAQSALSGEDFAKMTEADFSKFLDTPNIPDPDLIIRTSGEERLSGFLTWQSVYSELFFIKTNWPDFSKEEFNAILGEYGNRHRRFGK